jgi:hypothetical protein
VAKIRITRRPREVVTRNMALLEQVTRYLIDHPETLASLPEGFELVILPDDDPEIRSYNLELLDTYGSEGRPVVFVRTQSGIPDQADRPSPHLYAPVTV